MHVCVYGEERGEKENAIMWCAQADDREYDVAAAVTAARTLLAHLAIFFHSVNGFGSFFYVEK